MSFNIIKQLNADAQEGSATNDVVETAALEWKLLLRLMQEQNP